MGYLAEHTIFPDTVFVVNTLHVDNSDHIPEHVYSATREQRLHTRVRWCTVSTFKTLDLLFVFVVDQRST